MGVDVNCKNKKNGPQGQLHFCGTDPMGLIPMGCNLCKMIESIPLKLSLMHWAAVKGGLDYYYFFEV